MTAASPTVEVRELTRRFQGRTAVDRVSFTVRRGELFGLVGPDGAGKTTLLRMLAGILAPDAGEATLAGVDLRRDPERAKDRLAYMSQRFGLYGDLTVLENLHFYADLYQVPRAEREPRLERLFRFSNLEPFKDRLAAKLSGGMKQKLGLSCALIHQPEVLLLDEPTFGVDPISRRDLWLVVHDMVAHGVTVVVSTAYMDEAERFDRVALLHQGRVLALDTPQALQHALGRILAVRVERARQARDLAARDPRVRRAVAFGDTLHLSLRGGEDEVPAVLEALRQGGHAVAWSRLVEPSMEDVFVDRISEAGVS